MTEQFGGGAETSTRPVSAAITSEPRHVERAFRVTTTAGASPGEVTIVAGGGSDMESTTPPGGSGSSSGSPTPQFFECKPTNAEIKNVSKLTSGKLYGHAFDFIVELVYSTLSGGATASKDATLEWWEKTDRPPAWQTTVAKDTWNDMFALFPTSPTFDGWTKNRTKPNPGSETASIHDPPAASVDMPARTLEFDLKVKGDGVTKGATAKQVLEPDGKGGIKTQTFTVGK